MGMIGCLGEMVFTVSEETILTLDNMTWSGSARYATHQRHLTNALTEFTGVDPDKISFEMVLSASMGIDPLQEVVKLWGYERSGQELGISLSGVNYRIRALKKEGRIQFRGSGGKGVWEIPLECGQPRGKDGGL